MSAAYPKPLGVLLPSFLPLSPFINYMQEEGCAPSWWGQGSCEDSTPARGICAQGGWSGGASVPMGLSLPCLMAEARCFLAVRLGGCYSLKLRASNWEKQMAQ